MNQAINSDRYYLEYHGHPTYILEKIIDYFKTNHNTKQIVYLAGDSSLDNKYWVQSKSDAVNGYQNILSPPRMKRDICYHLNNILQSDNIVTINTSIEATTLGNRKEELLGQDKLIRDNITENDVIVISLGGNDIALQPSFSTIWNMFKLNYFNSESTIKKGPKHAWGMNYLVNMFKDSLEDYIKKLTSKNKPSKVIVSMIYYPDEAVTGSWADRILGLAGYNSNPSKMQAAIRQIYKHAICKLNVDSVNIVPFPMFKFMDGKDTNDYVARVEPSDQGGEKLARGYANIILKE